jgi:hypothetical protein
MARLSTHSPLVLSQILGEKAESLRGNSTVFLHFSFHELSPFFISYGLELSSKTSLNVLMG